MIDQAYATLVYTVMQGWEMKGKNKKNSDKTENLWCKAKNVMHHLTETIWIIRQKKK